jgi:hypothetical protein
MGDYFQLSEVGKLPPPEPSNLTLALAEAGKIKSPNTTTPEVLDEALHNLKCQRKGIVGTPCLNCGERVHYAGSLKTTGTVRNMLFDLGASVDGQDVWGALLDYQGERCFCGRACELTWESYDDPRKAYDYLFR